MQNRQTHQIISQHPCGHLQSLQALESRIAATQAALGQTRADRQISTDQYSNALRRLHSLEHQWRVANHYAQLAEGTDAADETKASADQLAEQVKQAGAEHDKAHNLANIDLRTEDELVVHLNELQTKLRQIERQARIDTLKAEMIELEAEQAQDLIEASVI